MVTGLIGKRFEFFIRRGDRDAETQRDVKTCPAESPLFCTNVQNAEGDEWFLRKQGGITSARLLSTLVFLKTTHPPRRCYCVTQGAILERKAFTSLCVSASLSPLRMKNSKR